MTSWNESDIVTVTCLKVNMCLGQVATYLLIQITACASTAAYIVCQHGDGATVSVKLKNVMTDEVANA
jgi:hypothetical protein